VAFSGATAGSTPISSYTVSATDQNHPTAPPVTATGPSSPITVKGLTNGDPYVFTVTAISADGTSPPSNPSGALSVGVAPMNR
jgi:large repetitive protein